MGVGRPRGARQISDDDRLRVRTLYFYGSYTKAAIQRQLPHVSAKQIRDAIEWEAKPETRGRKPKLNKEQEEELEAYVTGSAEGRQATFLDLSRELFDGQFGEWAIKNTLYRLGYRRVVAKKKPHLTDAAKAARLQFAEEHLGWSAEEWGCILWTDETWVTGSPYTRVYVTRKPGEELDDDCLIDRYLRKRGWMFWGSFSGVGKKGPGIFWEKKWKHINEQSYCEHIVPLIEEEINRIRHDLYEWVWLMQDNAPSHSSKFTRDKLNARGIRFIRWPANSPDLNPIEVVWRWMKQYIQERYGWDQNPPPARLRKYVLEAWETVVTEERLIAQLALMPQIMQLVKDAQGSHIREPENPWAPFRNTRN